jgi:hypothetical protein
MSMTATPAMITAKRPDIKAHSALLGAFGVLNQVGS